MESRGARIALETTIGGRLPLRTGMFEPPERFGVECYRGLVGTLSKYAAQQETAMRRTRRTRCSQLRVSAEMQYRDCFELAVDRKVGSMNALFITLKSGLDYRPGRASFVLDEAAEVAKPE